VKESQKLARTTQAANKGIPCRLLRPRTQANEDLDNYQGLELWVKAGDDIGNEMAASCDKRNSSSKTIVDGVVAKGAGNEAGNRRNEQEGYFNLGNAVVRLKLQVSISLSVTVFLILLGEILTCGMSA
jgi:hypothetical protein